VTQALRHIRYVLAANPVTGIAFALFLLLLLLALFGPTLAPYDPLTSDTASALQAPRHTTGSAPTSSAATSSRASWWRPASISALPRIGRPRLRHRRAGRHRRRIFRRLDGSHRRSFGRYNHGVPPLRAGDGIVAALGNTIVNIVYATAIINLPIYARVARSEANIRREAGYIEAARLSGNGEARILLAYVVPNILPIMMVQISLTLGYAILNAAGLSFIGLGVRPPTPEWGIMVAEGASFIISGEWWCAFFPGVVLMLAVFCFNLLGDGLRDIVDPRMRT